MVFKAELQPGVVGKSKSNTIKLTGLNLAGSLGHGMRLIKNLERLLIAFGALMLCVYLLARLHGFVLSRMAIDNFKSHQLFAQELQSGTKLAGNSPDFSLWSANRIWAYRDSLASHFQPPVALLRIPKIHLEAPVLEGSDDLILNRAVGHIVGTAPPGESGNIGLAGHRDGFFRVLKDVAVGDKIEIQTQQNTNTYVIDQITIVDPSDVSVLRPRSHPSVTLVTCYPFYFLGDAPQRYIVQASLVGPDGKTLNTSDDAEF
jgi:sortase A